MKWTSAAVLLGTLITGCSIAQIEAMDAASGLGVLTSEAEAFDGVRRVRLTPAFVTKAGTEGLAWAAPVRVGAQWIESAPDSATLILEAYDEIVSIRALGLNVDGELMRFETAGRTRFDDWTPLAYGDSTAYVPVPLDVLVGALADDGAMLRVHYGDGTYTDANLGALRGRGGALTARHYLRERFLPAVIEAATLAR